MYKKSLISPAPVGETAEWKSKIKSKNNKNEPWKTVDVKKFPFGIDFLRVNEILGSTNDKLRFFKPYFDASRIEDEAYFISPEFPEGGLLSLGEKTEVKEFNRNLQLLPTKELIAGCSLDGTNFEKNALAFDNKNGVKVIFSNEHNVDKTEEYIADMPEDSFFKDADGNPIGKCFESKGASRVEDSFGSEITFHFPMEYRPMVRNFMNVPRSCSRFISMNIKFPEDMSFDFDGDGDDEDLSLLFMPRHINSPQYRYICGSLLKLSPDGVLKFQSFNVRPDKGTTPYSGPESDAVSLADGEWHNMIIQVTEDSHIIVFIDNEEVLNEYNSGIGNSCEFSHSINPGILWDHLDVCFLPFGELSGTVEGTCSGIRIGDIELYLGEYDYEEDYSYISQETEDYYPAVIEIDVQDLQATPTKLYRTSVKNSLYTSLYKSGESEDDHWVQPTITSFKIIETPAHIETFRDHIAPNNSTMINDMKKYSEYDVIEFSYEPYEGEGVNFVTKLLLENKDIMVDGSLTYLKE